MTGPVATFPDAGPALRRAGRSALARSVESAMRRVPEGGTVLVAASGGADSTALALLAVAVAKRGRWRVALATVDHGLRAESAHDAAFVRALGAWLGVPVVARKVQVTPGTQVSASARKARYRALADMAGEMQAAAVLVAHHAEDQFETMLMRLVRGSGARAASGMPAVRRLRNGVRVVRPLLEHGREALRALLAQAELAWREDPGNANEDRPRGRLRHRILPELNRLAPGAAVRASRTARRVRGAAAALRREASVLLPGAGPWGRSSLRAAARETLAEALRRRFPGAGGDQVDRCVQAIRRRDTRQRRCRLGERELVIGVATVGDLAPARVPDAVSGTR